MTDTKGTEPLLSRAWLISLAGAIASVLAMFGVPATFGDGVVEGAQTYGGVLSTALLFAAPHVLAWLGRKKVTPLSAPKDVSGTPLVPAPVEVASAYVTLTPAAPDATPVVDADALLKAAADIHPGVPPVTA